MSRGAFVITLILGAVGLLLATDLHRAYRATVSAEESRLVSIASAIERNSAEQLRASGRMLDALRNDIAALSGSADRAERMNGRMLALADSVIGVRTLLHVSADGRVLSSNRRELIGENFRGSERYRLLRAGNDPEVLYVSPPFTTPLGVFTTSLGKVIVEAGGRFDGYVLAILDPAYFGVMMQSLLYADDMRISVAHGDGKVIFSTQTTPDLRGFDLSRVADSPFNRHLLGGQSASFVIDRATATGDMRFIAIRTVLPASGRASDPLVVAVSRRRDAVMADWRREAARLGLLYLGLVAAIGIGHQAYRHRQHAFRLLSREKSEAEAAAQARILDADVQFEGFFEQLPLGAVQLGADGRFQRVNDAYCRITGFAREALVGKLRPVDLTPAEDRADELVMMSFFYSTPDYRIDADKRLVRRDGRVIRVHVTASAVRDAAGRVRFTTAVVQDVTALRPGRDDQAGWAAEVASCAKTLELANLSHAMRAHLRQLTGAASQLGAGALDAQQRARLATIGTAARRIDAVTGERLARVGSDAGTTGAAIAPLDLAQLVHGVMAAVGDAAAAKAVTLHYAHDLPPGTFGGDAAALAALLGCCCHAAIARSPSGGSITIRSEPGGEDAGSTLVWLSVQDDGTDIDPAFIEQLFRPADPASPWRHDSAAGDLVVVRQLARLLGGDAGGEPGPDGGCVLRVSVRLAREEDRGGRHLTRRRSNQGPAIST